ncbi:MAG: hypothetical protein AAB646_02455 [Patescibacteria group bacterium]
MAKRWRAAVLFILCLTNCTGIPRSPLKSEYNIPLYGNFTEKQVEILDKLLIVLPENVVQSIASITVNNDVSHYENTSVVGHCHFLCGKLCFQSSVVASSSLWHEAAHAYSNYLKMRGSHFFYLWQRLAGNVYHKNYPAESYPRDGVLTKYGSQSYFEDIAETVEEFYASLRLVDEIVCRQSAFSKIKTSDLRYWDKLELLRDFGFITLSDYIKFAEKGLMPIR